MKNANLTVLILMICAMPFMAGCFFGNGGGNSNPVAAPSSVQNLAQAPLATANVGTVDPKILAAKFYTPSKEDLKKYSFAKGNCTTSKKYKEVVAGQLKKAFRIFLKKHSKADNIFITLKDMEVNTKAGKTLTFPLPATEINLKADDELMDVFSDVALPNDTYRYFAFNITSARYVKGNKSHDLYIPSKKVIYWGNFQIKDGYSTELSIKFVTAMIGFKDYFRLNFWKFWMTGKKDKFLEDNKRFWDSFVWTPVVVVSSKLVQNPAGGGGGGGGTPVVQEGTVDGTVLNYVSKAALSGITVAVEGTSFSATTDAQGKFSIANVPAGTYNVKFTSADYLDYSVSQVVEANGIHTINPELNPAVITSLPVGTEWFSLRWPLANANGQYGEVAMETPLVINFTSLAFTKVELAFDAEYSEAAIGALRSYISTTKQVQVLTDLGTWWVGNNATLGTVIGDFNATQPSSHYVVDVTQFVQSNPSAAYFMATKNLSIANLRLQNIKMSIYYR